MRRRRILGAGAAGLALAAGPAPAQTFPTRPLKIVVPFGPGGVADLSARVVGQKLAELLGQAVVIDNKPGAGGVIAGEAVARAEPDGHTLLLMSNGTAVSSGLFKSLPFDAQRDFTPVSTLGYFDLAVVVAEGSPFTSVAALLAHARAHPGKLNLGSINVGSTQHLAAELMRSSAGIEAQVVPFNGSPALLNALRGRQVDAAVEILGPLMGQVSARTIRPLALLGDHRDRGLPEVPTLAESGVRGFSVASWNALAVPAKTPAAVVNLLNRQMLAALASPDVVRRLEEIHVSARASTPAQAASLLASETRRWAEVIRRAGIAQQ